ncbi:MAG: histidine kinase, partial [Verrucomicrobiales bacterium]|nr:histidine kinase [Verrucomicrobiales bacterium]
NNAIIDIDFSLQPLRDETGEIVFLVPSASVITERKLAEAEIRDANEKFRQLADNISDAFWIRSPDFSEVQYASPAFEKIWGRSVESLKADPQQWPDLIFAEDRTRVLKSFSELTDDAPSLDIEYRIVRPGGEIRWVRARVFQVRNATDRLIRHVGVVTDITEWHQATDALRTSEAGFRTLAEAMPQIVWETQADGRNIYFNQQWMDYTGLTLEESQGEGWIKPFHPEDQEEARLSWQTATETKETHSMECRLRRADGVYRWWLVRGVPLQDTAGQIIKWVGTCTDIHELKVAQEKMSQQAALLDVAQDAILVKDLEGRIIYWNKGAERTYGWTSEEAIGSSSLELLQQEPVAHQKGRTMLLAHGSWQGEMISRSKAGSEIIADVRWTLVKDPHGQAQSVLAIHTEITGKKKLEAQFLRVQRMESIGTLASGIAHDLNNVLAPIMMSLEMLKDLAPGPDAQKFLDILQSCAQRGANLIKQVLSFARGVEGRRMPVNVVHILSDIENIIRDTFPKNIDFQFERPREPGAVLGDPTQLHQVFMNLCVNARDAMPLGGKLKVTIQHVMVDEIYADMNSDAKPGPYTIVQVEDTGLGIPSDIKSKIFEPFFTTKEIGKGTGLGLSTTLAIIKSHGGFINLYSEMGKGTQFKVYLPATPAARDGTEPAIRPALPRGEGELILVVDDEEPIRTVTSKTLERFNYRCVLAANGAEAIAVYARRGFEIALVLTDMAMPIMDGPATIVALRSLNPHVKIIGCSGHASTNGVAQALSAGVLHFIPKPYTAETLINLLHTSLSPEDEKKPVQPSPYFHNQP